MTNTKLDLQTPLCKKVLTLAPITDEQTKISIEEIAKNIAVTAINNSHKTILFTSTALAKSKIVTVFNLAISCASEGKKILLINCQSNNGTVNDIMGIEREYDKNNILIKPTISPRILPTIVKDLDILHIESSVDSSENCILVFNENNLLKIIEMNYDFAIINAQSNSYLASLLALNKMCSASYVVVAKGRDRINNITTLIANLGYNYVSTILDSK